jgi:hypothetical protein
MYGLKPVPFKLVSRKVNSLWILPFAKDAKGRVPDLWRYC